MRGGNCQAAGTPTLADYPEPSIAPGMHADDVVSNAAALTSTSCHHDGRSLLDWLRDGYLTPSPRSAMM